MDLKFKDKIAKQLVNKDYIKLAEDEKLIEQELNNAIKRKRSGDIFSLIEDQKITKENPKLFNKAVNAICKYDTTSGLNLFFLLKNNFVTKEDGILYNKVKDASENLGKRRNKQQNPKKIKKYLLKNYGDKYFIQLSDSSFITTGKSSYSNKFSVTDGGDLAGASYDLDDFKYEIEKEILSFNSEQEAQNFIDHVIYPALNNTDLKDESAVVIDLATHIEETMENYIDEE